MNRIPARLVMVSILVFSFISCKKNSADNNINNNNNNNTTSDSNYVDRIYIIDSTASSQDTSQVEIYTYDNLKRVTTIVDSMLNPAPELFAFKQFEYSGNDSLPFKSTLYIYDGNINRDTVITYHYFDNAGKLVKDSIIDIAKSTIPSYQIRQRLINISYSGNMMYGFTRDSAMFDNNVPTTYPAIIIIDTVTLDVNGNMAHTIQHRSATVYMTTNSFDNQPHPFKRLNIFMCWSPNIFQNNYYDPTEPNTNNITHVLETSTGGSSPYTHDFALFNSYYNNGFLKTTAHPESAGSPDYEKYLFIYKSL